MNFQRLSQRLMASSLILVLLACGATTPTVWSPSGQRELARHVLIIQEAADGSVQADWRPRGEFELPNHFHLGNASFPGGYIQRTGTSMDDDSIGEACDQVWRRCWDRCMSSPLPPHASHYLSSRKSPGAALHAFCTEECARERDACRKELERKARGRIEFERSEDAVEWLKRHKEEIAVGAIIVITGVAFCVVMGGGGVLVLAPIVLFTSPELPAPSPLAESSW